MKSATLATLFAMALTPLSASAVNSVNLADYRTNLFNPALTGLADIAEVFALSNLAAPTLTVDHIVDR